MKFKAHQAFFLVQAGSDSYPVQPDTDMDSGKDFL